MIFKTFMNMLRHDERIQFIISRKGDQLAVLVQPVLANGSNGADNEGVQNLRAALAMPLYVVADPDTLDTGFPENLAVYAGVRAQAQNILGDALSRVKEAGKQAHAGVAGVDAAAALQTKDDPKAETIPHPNTPSVEVSDKSLF